jgi:hypothetical protein
MCLIIIGHDRSVIREVLDSAIRVNKDGAGLLYRKDTNLVVRKSHETAKVEQFFEAAPPDQDLVIHLRMATQGGVDYDNTHPFDVGRGVFFMHNGNLRIDKHTPGMSDSWHFAQQIKGMVKRYGREIILDPDYIRTVEMALDGDRGVLADGLGNIVILNEHQWTKHKGVWVSNEYAWDAPMEEKRWVQYYMGGGQSKKALPPAKDVEVSETSHYETDAPDMDLFPRTPQDLLRWDLDTLLKAVEQDVLADCLYETDGYSASLDNTRPFAMLLDIDYKSVLSPQDYDYELDEVNIHRLASMLDGFDRDSVEYTVFGEILYMHLESIKPWALSGVPIEPKNISYAFTA